LSKVRADERKNQTKKGRVEKGIRIGRVEGKHGLRDEG
jgi:hypothetical protein